MPNRKFEGCQSCAGPAAAGAGASDGGSGGTTVAVTGGGGAANLSARSSPEKRGVGRSLILFQNEVEAEKVITSFLQRLAGENEKIRGPIQHLLARMPKSEQKIAIVLQKKINAAVLRKMHQKFTKLFRGRGRNRLHLAETADLHERVVHIFSLGLKKSCLDGFRGRGVD